MSPSPLRLKRTTKFLNGLTGDEELRCTTICLLIFFSFSCRHLCRFRALFFLNFCLFCYYYYYSATNSYAIRHFSIYIIGFFLGQIGSNKPQHDKSSFVQSNSTSTECRNSFSNQILWILCLYTNEIVSCIVNRSLHCPLM